MFLNIFLKVLIFFSMLNLSYSSKPECGWHKQNLQNSYPAGYYTTRQTCINNGLICCCQYTHMWNVSMMLSNMCNGSNNECCDSCYPYLHAHTLTMLK